RPASPARARRCKQRQARQCLMRTSCYPPVPFAIAKVAATFRRENGGIGAPTLSGQSIEALGELHAQRIHAASKLYSPLPSLPDAAVRVDRLSCARPRPSESTSHPAATGSEQSAIVPSFSPNACIVSKIQPDKASAPRYTTTSTRFFALYFSSRDTTVKNSWRAGFAIAKFIQRCTT